MHGWRRWSALAALTAVTALSVSACSKGGASEAESSPPVKVVGVRGTELHRVVLSRDALERIGLETEPVADGAGPGGTVVPYAALIYDPSGATWVYADVGPRTFERVAVTVDRVDEDTVRLTTGPAVGTRVVTVGAAEVYGSEFLSEHE